MGGLWWRHGGGGADVEPAGLMRPRAEDCERLGITALRGLLTPGGTACRLPGGEVAAVRWHACRGCYGRPGRALLVCCPVCSRPGRVLWRPPGRGWGCWRCCPVSHPSHRRPGGHRRHRRPGRSSKKPRGWNRQWLEAEQNRIARLLGLPAGTGKRRGWRDCLPLLWNLGHLRAAPRAHGTPRLSNRRREALEERLDALESLRILDVLAACPFRDLLSPPGDERPRLLAAYCRATLYLTEWAMRRPAHDPRTLRVGTQQATHHGTG